MATRGRPIKYKGTVAWEQLSSSSTSNRQRYNDYWAGSAEVLLVDHEWRPLKQAWEWLFLTAEGKRRPKVTLLRHLGKRRRQAEVRYLADVITALRTNGMTVRQIEPILRRMIALLDQGLESEAWLRAVTLESGFDFAALLKEHGLYPQERVSMEGSP